MQFSPVSQFSPVIVSLPIADRQTSFVLYGAGLGRQAPKPSRSPDSSRGATRARSPTPTVMSGW